MKKTFQTEYESDFYAWTEHNAKLLREGKWLEIDREHIAEEIESMGKGEKRELMNRLAVLIAHLLKWKFQPARRSKSWELTIQEQRFEIVDLLEESPSLTYELEKKISHAYQKALLIAEKETGFDRKTFPIECIFSLEKALDQKFFPD